MTYKISLSAVNVPAEAFQLMEQALQEERIGQSEYIEVFENKIAEFVGSKYCIAVSSGTMADAIAVATMKWAFGFKRVIIPALTFIAQPNAARYTNTEIQFCDVKEDWTIDVSKAGPGFPSLIFSTDIMGRIFAPGGWSLEHQFIEDACEAFGSRLGERFAGTFGKMGTFSFFPSHTISTGEGGAIVTDDKSLADHCRSLRNHGRKESIDPLDKFTFEYFGFNAKMSSMQAVIGIAVMSHIWEYLDQRRRVFKWLQRGLGGFVEAEDEEIIPHGYPVQFESETARDKAMRNILESGIECRKFFSCIPCSEMPYKEYGNKFPVADHIGRTHLYVPSHQLMGREECDYIIQVVKEQEGLVK